MADRPETARRVAVFAWLVLAYNIGVILWGAYVRATGSGAGCGEHWPLCNGVVLPRDPSAATLIEFSHRLTSGLALVAVVVLLVWVFRTCAVGHPARRGAVWTVFFMLTEAGVGAGLVLFRLVADNASMARALFMAVHLLNTFVLLAWLSLTAWWLSGGVRLTIGLSGFETGVAVMPLVRGDRGDTADNPAGRVRNTRRLLRTAAGIMSVMLIGSSFTTALLIPPAAFAEGGAASGRALSYLAHEHLGDLFGTAYDISTIAILWFAGASAMAGLLNLVPRYLPRYGMAPEWTRATRPLVALFTAITFLITVLFEADVEAQGGAYATGVLVLMTSAAVAVTLYAWRRLRRRTTMYFAAITLVFAYTTVTNIIERPDGVKIASWFIATIIVTSMVSRVMRSTELRVLSVEADTTARRLITEAAAGQVRIIANRPDTGLPEEYAHKLREARESHHLPDDYRVLFVEVRPGDASEFGGVLPVHGVDVGGHHVLRCTSPAIPNAIAALLLYIRDQTNRIPHAYFGWTEGNPIAYLLKFLAFGEGDTAPVTREVLRQAEPDQARRPRVHVG